MSAHALFQERVVRLEKPQQRYLFLIAHNGQMLGLDDDEQRCLCDEGNDRVVWDRIPGGFRHVATGVEMSAAVDGGTCTLQVGGERVAFTPSLGPEQLPSAYLRHLRQEGWVCLTCILPDEVVLGLERVACTDRFAHLEQTQGVPKICQDVAVARAVCEPISLWLIRNYLGTEDLHLGHPPGFGVLSPYEGTGKVQRWHVDIPYIPSIGGNPVADRKGPIKAVQRNVCVSDFTKERGATAYKLGSHLADTPPPPAWNAADANELGLPYSGPDADVVEAPAGSIILYDARTWHRAGINRSKRKRAGMLQSFQTADVIPKRDTRHACARLHESAVYPQLNDREQREITELLMNQPRQE